jgi:protein involved in polysaccharide export with SLBB domain
LTVDLDKANFIGDFNSDPCLYAGVKIYVPGKSDKVVQVVGEVNSPREIEFLTGDNLEILLRLSGGLRGSADSSSIYILRSEQKITDIQTIQAGDIIVVPPKEKTELENQVALFGAINNPGYYKIEENLNLTDLIAKSGGYQADASISLTTIFRRPRFDVSGRVTQMRYPISANFKDSGKLLSVKIQASDSIFVPVKVGYVRIRGEVLNPGYYPYSSTQKAGDYITNAGGFLPTANDEELLFFNPVSKITSIVSTGVFIPDGGELIIQKKEELK